MVNGEPGEMRLRLWSTPPLLRSTDNYISAVNTARFLQGKGTILIVGDAGGRDYRYLSKEPGREIHVLDIANQNGIPNLVVQSIEDRTPWDDGFFDGVVMNEVLEHLFRDVDALEEVWRILRPDGILVVTVPYVSNGQDISEHHARVHTSRTLQRLLERCGFKIREHFYRGVFSRFIQLSPINRAAIYLAIKLVEVTLRAHPDHATQVVNGVFERLERTLGKSPCGNNIQRISRGYGGILCAEKVREKQNSAKVQRLEFENRRFV